MGGGGGGGGGGMGFNVRDDFEYTPLWAPHVVTDENGRASVSVTLPDNLTTWRLDARAVDLNTHVGQTTNEIVSTLPLIVRPAAPRFFVVGDRVTLVAVINNNTDDEQVVQVELQQSGLELVDPIPETVTIAGGSRARVEWTAIVQDVPVVDLTFFAQDENGNQDAAKPALTTGPDNTIPVYQYIAPDTTGTGGVLREGGSRTEAISLPPRLENPAGDLTIQIDPSLAATTIETLDYLRNYPHQCIEQTVSRFLPNVITYRALESLGIQDAELKANLDTSLVDGLNMLYQSQNPDGGWGWFPGHESNPLVTAYALLGMIETRNANLISVDTNTIDRGIEFLKADFVRPVAGGNTPSYQLNRQAFYYYVLSRYGQGSESDYILLYNTRLSMSFMGRAYLLMAAHEINPESSLIPGLVSDLTNAAIVSATGAHWEEAAPDWWNWGSDTRTTAVVLNALVRVQPDNPLGPNVVRWLMVARRGDHWETTQENAWAVMALTDWMVATGELQGNYTYEASLNRESLLQNAVTPETIRDGQTLQIEVADLLSDEINRLTIGRGEGSGALYYTAHLNLDLPAAEVDALSRGITVSREYFLDGNSETPITEARVGDVIDVRLTITLPEDIYYFVLEDPLPAGTESVDTSLLTTSQVAEGPTIERQLNEDPYWYWGWWWFDETELRDEQTNLYADFLPRGTYVYSYQIRASVPGEFQTRPAQAYAFYFPEVFGRTSGSLFTVTDISE
jgi:alpha-2-macroglobulin